MNLPLAFSVLVDYHGNIIDGNHRLNIDKNWKSITIKHIKTQKDLLIARLISNTVRRSVSRKEKTKILEGLGKIILSEGVKPGKIAAMIADNTGMSYTWVMRYLPERFKDKLQSERRANSVTRLVTGILDDFLKPPKQEGALKISKYVNTKFVSLILEKDFYQNFERNSVELGVSPEVSILKALEAYNANMQRAITIVQREVTWETYEHEFINVIHELKRAGVEGVVFGDIHLQEHKDWLERVCNELSIKAILPL